VVLFLLVIFLNWLNYRPFHSPHIHYSSSQDPPTHAIARARTYTHTQRLVYSHIFFFFNLLLNGIGVCRTALSQLLLLLSSFCVVSVAHNLHVLVSLDTGNLGMKGVTEYLIPANSLMRFPFNVVRQRTNLRR